MKVLHVGKFYPPHRGGMESTLQTLSDELSKKISVEVLVSNDDTGTCAETINAVKVLRAGKLFDVAGTPVCPLLANRIRKSTADLVHIHWPNPAAVLAYLASGRRGPLVITWHSDVVRQRFLEKLFRPFLDSLLAQCDAIVVTSQNYLETSPMLARHRDRCEVIPFGIHPSLFARADTEAVARIRNQFGAAIILAVGRLVYYKGFEYLIRAMRKVEGKLLITGEGPLRQPLEDEIQRLGVQDRVSILDAVDDLLPYYHGCDMFVLPSVSRSEAFGIVQLEAMACGKPVINTALDSGVPFVSRHFETGLTVQPRDAESLAHSINFLLGDSRLRVKFGSAARRRIQEHFSVERMMRRTLELYYGITATYASAETEARTVALTDTYRFEERLDSLR